MNKNKDLKKEKIFINKIFASYNDSSSSFERQMRKFIFRIFGRYIKGGRGLELGCSDGFLTKLFSDRLDELDIVDGSIDAINSAKKRGIKANFILSLFEEFTSGKKYDYVFASYMLEHVLDPKKLMQNLRKMLKPEGLVFIVVPNSNALSRQLALRMGLLKKLKELTPNDIDHGHRRVFDRQSLDKLITSAGFENVDQGGIFLKILADFQLDKLIDDNFLNKKILGGLYQLGMEYPEFCGSLYSICKIR